jgi:hypothetical protein
VRRTRNTYEFVYPPPLKLGEHGWRPRWQSDDVGEGWGCDEEAEAEVCEVYGVTISKEADGTKAAATQIWKTGVYTAYVCMHKVVYLFPDTRNKFLPQGPMCKPPSSA